MSTIANKIATLQASLANSASTYYLTKQALLANDYSYTDVYEINDKGHLGICEAEDGVVGAPDFDVLVSRMAASLRWMNQVEIMLANMMSDYYRNLAVEIVRSSKEQLGVAA